MITRTETVRVSEVTERPDAKNPRRGSVDDIVESLKEFGQYKAIVVRESTGDVLAGNHTLKAIKKLGWEWVHVTYVDVDDETAERIVVADNRINDKGTYDADVLAEVLAGVPDLSGTGFTDRERDLILAVQPDDAVTRSLLIDVMSPPIPVFGTQTNEADLADPADESGEAADRTLGDEEEFKPETLRMRSGNPRRLIENLDQLSGELEGILALRDSVTFPVENEWGIPTLREDMLVQKLPEGLDSWAGHGVTPDEGGWWLYNYGADSFPVTAFPRAILSFYTHDQYFERFWSYPSVQVSKVINGGIRMAVTPNYSMYTDDPPAVQLWNLYRSRWLGRYMQEAGVEVIPDLQAPDKGWVATATKGLPDTIPVAAMQVQTFHNDEEEAQTGEVILEFLHRIGIDHVLFYGGKPGLRLVESLGFAQPYTYLMNRAEKRRGTAFDYEQKEEET